MRGKLQINQSKLTARRRRRIMLLSLYGLLAVGLLVCAISYISQLSFMNIATVNVTGNSRLSAAQVQEVALKDLAGNYGYLFSRRNIFVYPDDQIQKDVAAMPLVKSVTVASAGMTAINISVIERGQTSAFCQGSIGDYSDCYSMDDNGFIFAKAADTACSPGSMCPDASSASASSTAPVPFDGAMVYRMATTSDPIGTSLLNPTDFKKVAFFLGELGSAGVDPREAVFSTDSTDTPPYMTVVLGQGGQLLINTADDLSQVLSNLQAVLADRTVAPSVDDFLAKLDYMHLDVGDKIVYKLKK